MEDDYTEIGNGSATVRVRKVRTGNGARLEIHSPELGRRVYLDALLLESLSWQTLKTFSESLEAPPNDADAREMGEGQVASEGEYTEISNEFATTLVRKVRTENGPRLEVFSPKLDYRIHLDAPLLESLTRQTPTTLSKFLEEPYGPAGTHEGEEGIVDLG